MENMKDKEVKTERETLEKIVDIIIKHALEQYLMEKYEEEMQEPAIEVEFSERHKKNMKAFFKKCRRDKIISKCVKYAKTVIVALIVVIAFLLIEVSLQKFI